MRLLVQSDDFGISKAVSLGIIEGIRNGVVRNTGMFANMPNIEGDVELIKPYLDQIAFGIDLNLSTGSSVLSHDQIPHLTKEDNAFFTSRENRALDTDENNKDHLAMYRDEVYAEFKAQIEKYISLVGHKPDYIHNHAYFSTTIFDVTVQLAKEYGVLSSTGLHSVSAVKEAPMAWYAWGDPTAQLSSDPIGFITTKMGDMLNSEYVYLVSHCGYADADLFKLSSLNAARVKDLEAMCSDEVKAWVKDNNIELVSFKDFPKEWI